MKSVICCKIRDPQSPKDWKWSSSEGGGVGRRRHRSKVATERTIQVLVWRKWRSDMIYTQKQHNACIFTGRGLVLKCHLLMRNSRCSSLLRGVTLKLSFIWRKWKIFLKKLVSSMPPVGHDDTIALEWLRIWTRFLLLLLVAGGGSLAAGSADKKARQRTTWVLPCFFLLLNHHKIKIIPKTRR